MPRTIRTIRLSSLVIALGAAGAAVSIFALPALARPAKPTPVVTVTATEFKFKLSSAKMPLGTVVFRVKNAGKITHDFKIDGKKTPILKPGQTATLRVTFKKSGRFTYVCTVPGHAAAGMEGVLAVGKATVPIPKPTTSTRTNTTPTTTTTTPAGAQAVQVGMTEFKFALSKTTVKVGTVVFTATNQGGIDHNFALPALGVSTPNVPPGGSATLTVTFTKPGTYSYLCTLPQHADAGMEGTLTVVP